MDVVIQHYNHYMALADDRVKDWLLMSSPWPTLFLATIYLLIVRVGPKFMSRHQPVEIFPLLLAYNVFQCIFNLYIFSELLIVSYHLNYSYWCQPVNYSNGYYEMRMAAALWWYYISKLVDFIDTLIIIARKKNNQLTFLHVYHHTSMFTLWWIGVKYVAGGSSWLGAMANCSVHVIMYAYYALSTIGTHKYLWWKKYLTLLQMIQFVYAIFHASYSIWTQCDFPLWMQYALVFYAFSLVLLFANFYYHAYKKRKWRMSAKKSMLNGHVD